MRITLNTLTIAFIFALIATIISLIDWSFGNFIYSFIMTFGFIIIPVFVCVCIFHFMLNIYKWTKRKPALIIQILTLCLIFNIFLLLIQFPDFMRHQNDAGYVRYNSFAEYFLTNILEGSINATIFSVLIPVLDKFFKNKILKFNSEKL
jgi:hypothetical protein